ncbi:MAG: hypothetical protein K0S41_3527 [Anaerocolumna sp.]|jgi:signal peptidase II|nr:hypothetical protein [Anaerocolumna sp.]
MKRIRHLIYIVLLLVFDQLTKYLVLTNLKGKDSFQIIPGVLQLHYHENTGAVWGIMSGQTGLLVAFSVLIMIGMIFVYFKIPMDKRYDLMRIILIFIAAGALGNFIDRITRKYVVDFIYFELIDFPIFNVADCYITISTFLLILLSLFYYKDEDFSFLNKKEKTVENGSKDE